MTERLMVLANVGPADDPYYEEAHVKHINEEGHAVVAFADGDEAVYVNRYHPAGLQPMGVLAETAAPMTPEAKLKKAQGQLKLRTAMDKAHALQVKWKGKRGDEAKAGRAKAKEQMDKVHATMKKNGWASIPSIKALTNSIARLSEGGKVKPASAPASGNKGKSSEGKKVKPAASSKVDPAVKRKIDNHKKMMAALKKELDSAPPGFKTTKKGRDFQLAIDEHEMHIEALEKTGKESDHPSIKKRK